nr:MAG TPA: hypothetical protein [Caudoviricetes sp.]
MSQRELLFTGRSLSHRRAVETNEKTAPKGAKL